VHNSLHNNGMLLFVVKILAAGFRRAINSDVLASILSMQFGKFPANIEFFRNFCKYFIFVEGICCACRAVDMAQVV
jgi:hypothetical protein